MASPWKLLARLVSPRREQKEQNGAADDVTSEEAAVVNPTETADDDRSNSTDRPAGKDPQPHDQSNVVSAEPLRSEEATGRPEALRPSRPGEGTPRKRAARGKKAEAVGIAPARAPVVPSFSDDAMSLDEEINLLRGQLTSKLQLQNAQLKTMLERFDR